MRTYLLALLGVIGLSVGLSLVAGAGPVQDQDGDTVPDASDNCILVPNAPPLDCDTNGDGFGNFCDADLNNDGFEDALDATPFVNALGGTPTPPETTVADGDLNCDTFTDALDATPFVNRLQGAGTPGPSAFAP